MYFIIEIFQILLFSQEYYDGQVVLVVLQNNFLFLSFATFKIPPAGFKKAGAAMNSVQSVWPDF